MSKKFFQIFFLTCLILIVIPTSILAEDQPKWNFFQTENFKITFNPEAKEPATQVAMIAEEVFADLCEFTGFEPYRKIDLVVSTYEDFANGATYPRDLIWIWVNPLYLSTRTDTQWLRNLVTHELTHLTQMETTFGFTYLLHKYTGSSSILSLPANAFHPTWFLEGIAQYGSMMEGYDQLDRKRQMVFEQKIHSDSFYTDAELLWGRSDLGHEIKYNYGFGFFEYLMRTYGEEKFIELQRIHSELYLLGLDTTIRMVYGKPYQRLIADWKAELVEKYPLRTDRELASRLVEKPNLAQWSEVVQTPAGNYIFLESQTDRPQIAVRSWSSDTGLKTIFASPTLAFSRLDLSPTGEKLLYTGYDIIDGSIRFDLYEYNLSSGTKKRLTQNQRIYQGIYFKNGYLVVKNDWGQGHLYYLHDNQWTQITDTDYNFAITDLALSPDEKRLAVNFNYEGRRGIGIMNTQTWAYEKIFYPEEGEDWLVGQFMDNQRVILSWDRLDHYDLYSLNVETGIAQRLTNTRQDILEGGIVSEDGEQFWYGQIYGADGFTVAKGSIKTQETVQVKSFDQTFEPMVPAKVARSEITTYHPWEQIRSVVFLPQAGLDDDTITFGVSQLLTDPLEQLSILYSLNYNYNARELALNLDTTWTGNNHRMQAIIDLVGREAQGYFVQSYDAFPYTLALSETISYEEKLSLDQIQLQLSRSWVDSLATTGLQLLYYPATSGEDNGYAAIFQHGQEIPVGYQGDAFTVTTSLGYAGGSTRFHWGGDDSSMLWVYPESTQARGYGWLKGNYQHTLLDLSHNFTNAIQTGRLYAHLFGEVGLFTDSNEWTVGEMFGAGLELESMVFHLIPLNFQLQGGMNTQGDQKVQFGVNMSL